MLSSKDNNGTVYSFRDNSPILKNNLFDALFAKVKFAKIFIWSSEGLVQKELTPDTSNVTVFVKDTAIVLFRKLGSQWFTGNYVGVLSLGNDSNIEIFQGLKMTSTSLHLLTTCSIRSITLMIGY